MKRASFTIYILCLGLLLSGCSSGSIYSNYRDIQRILVVQTIGIDLSADGKIILSVSSSKFGDDPPYRLWAEADTITDAQCTLQNYLPDKELFFPHISYILVGESAARDGIGGLLDFVGRSEEMRIDTPMLVVKNGTARDLIMGAGGENHDVTELLASLQRSLEKRGEAGILSMGDMSRAIGDGGAAILCAVEGRDASKANPGAKDGELTAEPAGFGVFSGKKLTGFVPDAAARGVTLLLGSCGSGKLEVNLGSESYALSLDRGGSRVVPVWGGDGNLRRIKISVTVSAGLSEMHEPHRLTDAFLDKLDNAFSGSVRDCVSTVLDISKSLDADFLGLGRRIEVSAPDKYGAMPRKFSDQLKNLVFDISVNAKVERSYDLADPAQNTGDSEGG